MAKCKYICQGHITRTCVKDLNWCPLFTQAHSRIRKIRWDQNIRRFLWPIKYLIRLTVVQKIYI